MPFELPEVQQVFRAISTGHSGVQSDFKGTSSAISGAAKDAESSWSTSMGKAMSTVKSAADTITKTLGLPLIAFAAASVKAAATFQSQMLLIQTQAGASAAEVKNMSQAVLGLAGAKTGQTAEALAVALYHVESTGLRGASALKVLTAAAQGATIGHADLTSVTNALTAAVVSGIKGAQDYQAAMSNLNATVGAGDMTMQDLANAMGTGILASAKVFGLGLTDVNAALATLGDNNIRGSKAATGLRMTLSMMGAPSIAATKAFAAMGLGATQLASDMHQPNGLLVALTDLQNHLSQSAYQSYSSEIGNTQKALAGLGVTGLNANKILLDFAQGNKTTATAALKALGVSATNITSIMTGPFAQDMAVAGAQLSKYGLTSDQVTQALDGMGPSAVVQADLLAKAFGGGRTSSTILTLLNQMDRLKSKYTAIGDASNAQTFLAAWNETTKTLSFQTKAMEQSFQAFEIEVGTRLIPIVTSLMHALTNLFSTFESLPPDVKKLLLGGAGAVIGGSAAISIGSRVVGAGIKVGKGIGTIGQAVGATGKAVGKGIKTVLFGKGASGIEGAAAQGIEAAAPEATFAGAVTEFAAAVAAFAESSSIGKAGGVGGLVDKFGKPLGGGLGGEAALGGEEAAGGLEAGAGGLEAGAGGLVGLVGMIPVAGQVALALAAVGAALFELYEHVAWFRDAVNTAWDYIKVHWVTIVEEIGLFLATGGIGAGLLALYDHVTWFRDAVEDVWKWLQDATRDTIGAVEATIRGLATAWDAVFSAGATVVGVLVSAWNTSFGVAKTIFGGIETGWKAVAGVVSTVNNAILTVVRAAWELIKIAIEVPFAVVSAFISVNLGIIKGLFDFFWPQITAGVADAWDLIETVTTAVWGAIVDVISAVWDTITTVITFAWGVISAFLVDAWHVFATVVSTVWGAIVAVFTTVWDAIKTVITTVWDWIKSFLELEWQGMVVIATSMWNDISGPIMAVWHAIDYGIRLVWSDLKTYLTAEWHTFSSLASSIWSGISNGIATAWDDLPGAIGQVWDDVKGAFVNGINDVIDIVNTFINALNAILGPLGSAVHIGTIGKVGSPSATRVPKGAALLGAGGQYASGGTIGAGFMTRGAQAVVGEGNPHYPEFVIPTDPKYRSNAHALLGQLMPKMATGGVLGAILGVNLGNVAKDVISAPGKAISAVADAAATVAADAVIGPLKAAGDLALSTLPKDWATEMGTAVFNKMANGALDLVQSVEKLFGGGGKGGSGGPSVGSPAAANAALGQQMASARGWTGVQWTDLNNVAMRESGWSMTAANPTSGARGIAQFINGWSEYAQYGGNATTASGQITAFMNYIAQRYGSPANAWAHEQIFGWYKGGGKIGVRKYDSGGILPPGLTLAVNNTGINEQVSTGTSPNVTTIGSASSDTAALAATAVATAAAAVTASTGSVNDMLTQLGQTTSDLSNFSASIKGVEDPMAILATDIGNLSSSIQSAISAIQSAAASAKSSSGGGGGGGGGAPGLAADVPGYLAALASAAAAAKAAVPGYLAALAASKISSTAASAIAQQIAHPTSVYGQPPVPGYTAPGIATQIGHPSSVAGASTAAIPAAVAAFLAAEAAKAAAPGIAQQISHPSSVTNSGGTTVTVMPNGIQIVSPPETTYSEAAVNAGLQAMADAMDATSRNA